MAAFGWIFHSLMTSGSDWVNFIFPFG
jgi:hypothetical protein